MDWSRHDLLGHLAQIADPRHRRGRRHPLSTVLAVAMPAVLAGARSLAAIGEWAGDAPGQVLAALGVRRDLLSGAWRPPGEATVRRVLAHVDADALDRAIGAWLAVQHLPANPPSSTPRPWRWAVAVDGKTVRGSGHPHAHRSTCWRRWTTPPCRPGPDRRGRHHQPDHRVSAATVGLGPD
jgi:hypothetical protein